RRVVEAANGKQIMFFPARHDHHLVQTGDGYAAHVSGAIGVSTDAQASWWGGRGIGTVPHGLIAAYNGDTVLAAQKYAEYMEPTANLVVLVDWENDCVRTALEVARVLKDRLWGVRLDTSETMVDVSVQKHMGDFDPRGVNPQLCHLVRRALDREGFEHVKIVASGGFNVDKIKRFEREHVPVDAYGVGRAVFPPDRAARAGDLTVPNVTIVVDVLNGFCKQGNLASPRCDAAIPKIREVIEERLKSGD